MTANNKFMLLGCVILSVPLVYRCDPTAGVAMIMLIVGSMVFLASRLRFWR